MTNTELIILGLVAENPKHGYQLEQDIAQRGMREWTEIGFSSIYYVLNKLETAGWLTSVKEDATDRPARKIYQLTSAGLAALRQAILDRVTTPRAHTSDFDLALANLGILSGPEAQSALQTRHAALTAQLAHIEAKAQADHRSGIPWFVDELFQRSLILLRAELVWLTALLARQPFAIHNPSNKLKESEEKETF